MASISINANTNQTSNTINFKKQQQVIDTLPCMGQSHKAAARK
jgi:hypothetical protein